jgi:hypothetical protein
MSGYECALVLLPAGSVPVLDWLLYTIFSHSCIIKISIQLLFRLDDISYGLNLFLQSKKMFEAQPYSLPQYFELPIFLPPVVPFTSQIVSPFNLPKVREVPPMKRTADQVTQISSFEIPQARDSKLPQGARSCRWSEHEDSILKDHIVIHGTKAWAKAATKINETLYGNQVIRQGKHCRERWCNHLNPSLNSNIYSRRRVEQG